MTAALVLAWKFDNGASQIHEFCAEPGEMSVLVREVAACMEIVDGGAALWRRNNVLQDRREQEATADKATLVDLVERVVTALDENTAAIREANRA